MADNNKKKGIPFKELPRHCKILRIVILALMMPGLIMTIIGTALGIAGIGVLFGGLFTFILPALVVAIIDLKFEKKFQKEYEARQANPNAAPVQEAKDEPAPAVENKPEPQPAPAPSADSWICPSCGAQMSGKFCVNCGAKKPEPQPEPEPAPVVEEVEPIPEPVIEEPAPEEPSFEPEPQPAYQANNNGNPEKKSNKKILVIILIIVGALVLVGGGVGAGIAIASSKKNKNNEDGPRDDEYSYVAPSSKPSSSNKPSSSSAKPSSQPQSSVAPTWTPKEVMAEICTNIYGSAKYYDDNNEDYNYWYSDSGFVTYVIWDTLDETYLEAAVEFVVEKLPSYLVNIDELHSGTWSDGLNGYFQNFVSEDEQVMVEIGSYYENDELNCQILSHFNI